MASCPIPIGEILAGKYRIERVLGEGGMGVVVLAYHLELEQQVAIKFLLEDMAEQEEGAERFRREARAAAKIHSDHVVRVLDVGIMDDGVRYMVMEYLEGRDLAEELAERRTFPIGAACGFILEALDAVGQAHAVGIVHRDLKPANLFLARRHDGSQRVKVLDFGISKTVGSSTSEQLSLTKTSAWIGSPLYMAPEQMQSARDVDARADIWSLGAILYELIVGAPPYEAESLPQLCNLLITTDAPHIQSRAPVVPDDLAAAIMGCLVRDKEQRIQTAGELARALARYATTITGTGMSRSLLDRTELHTGMPPSLQGGSIPSGMYSPSFAPSVPGRAMNAQLSDSGERISFPGGAETAMAGSGAGISGGTHAAWGATDGGKNRSSGGLIALVAGALLLAGGVGFFFFGGAGSAEQIEQDSAVMATQAELDAAVAAAAQAEAEKKALEAKVAEEAAKEAEAKLAAEAEAKAQAEAEAKKQAEAEAEAKPAPAPVVIYRPAPAPKPAPAPAPAPAPQPSNGFDDFGGRR